MAGRKRKAVSDPIEAPASSPTRRQSGRAKKVQTTYAESDAESVPSSDEFHDAVAEQSESEAEIEEQEEDDDDESDASEVQAKKNKGWKKTKTSDGREQMVIDIPGLKHAGGTPYDDARIHRNTMEFLGELKANNKREWLKFHDTPFR